MSYFAASKKQNRLHRFKKKPIKNPAYPVSDNQQPVFSYQDRATSIKYPESSNQNPATSIQHRELR